jgi:hypothetical protein
MYTGYSRGTRTYLTGPDGRFGLTPSVRRLTRRARSCRDRPSDWEVAKQQVRTTSYLREDLKHIAVRVAEEDRAMAEGVISQR